jgi:toxic protein SymE
MEEIIMAKKRSIKVYGRSGYRYRETPTIMLKGKWLEELGFKIGDYIFASCENGKLTIIPDAERTAMEAAESEFMEQEMKDLKKRFDV